MGWAFPLPHFWELPRSDLKAAFSPGGANCPALSGPQFHSPHTLPETLQEPYRPFTAGEQTLVVGGGGGAGVHPMSPPAPTPAHSLCDPGGSLPLCELGFQLSSSQGWAGHPFIFMSPLSKKGS